MGRGRPAGTLFLVLLISILGCTRRREAPAQGPAKRGGAPVEGRVLFDFLASRPLALLYEDGALVITGAGPDLDKFSDGGFRAGLIPGERAGRAALAAGVLFAVRFPGGGLPGAVPLVLTLALRPAADVPRQAVTVLLNERILTNLELGQGASSYRVPLPPGRLLPGENLLRLHFRAAGTIGEKRSAAAIERITLGPAAAPAPPGGRVCSFTAPDGDVRQALCAVRPTRWSYYLVPPQQPGRVRLSLSASGAAVRVSAVRDGAAEELLLSVPPAPAGFQEAGADVSRLFTGDGALRIDLALSGPGAIAAPRLVLATDGAGRADGPLPDAIPKARAEHLLVFAVDALRDDRVPRRLPERLQPGEAPAFVRLLQRGVRLSAVSQGNYPLPAHAALLSSTYPAVHRLLREADRLPESLPLCSEALQRAGFATGLFAASGYVSDRFGLARGFDVYRNLVREGRPSQSQEVWKVARPWLAEQVQAGRRVFLYLATADPHAPYNPQERHLLQAARLYAGPLRGGVTADHLLRIRRGKLRLQPADRAHLLALYDGEVEQTEATLGEVLLELERLGIADRTAVLLIGSHGEELFDHGQVGHGHSLHEELVRVPLVLAYPPRLPSGRILPLQAELIDIAPTLLHLAGAAVPDSMQGESLVPLLAEAVRMPRAGVSAHEERARSLSCGRYKLITLGGDALQLFDLPRDPHEQHDVAAEQPTALRALRNAFSLLHAQERRWQKARFGTACDLRSGFSEDTGW